MRSFLSAATVAFGSFQFASAAALPFARRQNDTSAAVPQFDWTSISPTDDLKTLTPCFGQFQCGRLNVALDWTQPGGSKAVIAVQILPAEDPAKRAGSILFNPGGPGNEGTLALLKLGGTLRKLFGPTYDIIGFDPRGVGATEPSADCFQPLSEWVKFQQGDIVSIDGEDDLGLYLARGKLIGEQCKKTLADSGEFFDSSSTASDMLAIAIARGEQKVNYFGISYGSLIGQHFAAMYPDRVGLFALDGILDAERWRAGTIETLASDGEQVADAFGALCAAAGPETCALAEATPEDVLHRVDRILAGLMASPLPVPESRDGQLVLTFDFVRYAIRDAIYEPLNKFALTANLLLAIETRNTTAVAEWFNEEANPITGLGPWSENDNAELAIACSDLKDIRDRKFEQALTSLNEAANSSRTLGSVASRIGLQCVAGWPFRPKNAFAGKFEANNVAGKILFLSNLFDPATPLSDAREVQQRYTNSALVIQQTIGHTTLLNAGNCIGQTVGQFYQAGVLPESGRICKPDLLPFVGAVDDTSKFFPS